MNKEENSLDKKIEELRKEVTEQAEKIGNLAGVANFYDEEANEIEVADMAEEK